MISHSTETKSKLRSYVSFESQGHVWTGPEFRPFNFNVPVSDWQSSICKVIFICREYIQTKNINLPFILFLKYCWSLCCSPATSKVLPHSLSILNLLYVIIENFITHT